MGHRPAHIQIASQPELQHRYRDVRASMIVMVPGIVEARNTTVMARLVRATNRGTAFVQVARTSRAMTVWNGTDSRTNDSGYKPGAVFV